MEECALLVHQEFIKQLKLLMTTAQVVCYRYNITQELTVIISNACLAVSHVEVMKATLKDTLYGIYILLALNEMHLGGMITVAIDTDNYSAVQKIYLAER